MMLKKALDRYASNRPGSRSFEDDLVDVGKSAEGGKNNQSHIQTSSVAEELRNSRCESAFADEIKRGISRGTAVDTNTASDISQIAYAGTLLAIIKRSTREVHTQLDNMSPNMINRHDVITFN